MPAQNGIVVPAGRAAIYAFYGYDAQRYPIGEDGRAPAAWERDMIVTLPLPAPLGLSWDRSKTVSRISCHRKVAAALGPMLYEIHGAGLWPFLNPYGGGYAWRLKRGSGRLSMHALGAAWDFDPDKNPMREGIVSGWSPIGGTKRPWRMDDGVVEIVRRHGFTWGGDFDDPMHVQFGRGY